MKNIRFLSILSVTLLGVSGYVIATPVCNSGATCETPAATAQSGLTLNAGSILGLQSLNSVGPNGNQVNSNYFFAVTTTNQGATVATINNSGDGTTVVGVTPTHNGSASPGSTVTAGSVQGTKGGTNYYVYAQACPSATSANGTNCSLWAKVDASQVTTAAYPASVFAAPTKPTDATVNSINARTAVPAGDVANVSVINLTIDDLINAANNQTLASITYVGNGSPYAVNNTLYTNGFKPNNKYQYTGQVQYPWDLVPTGGPQTEGPFWTTPENPGTVAASNVTHCSVKITAQNSNASTPNPTYTEYSLCAGVTCLTSGRIGGTPLSSDTTSETIVGLTPNTTYTPNGTALVGDQDGTQTGWNSSGKTNGTNFTTQSFGSLTPLSMGTITTNTAVVNITGVVLGVSDSWQIVLDGTPDAAAGASGVGNPPASVTLSGLNPNTAHTVQIKLTDAAGGCSTVVPVTALGFTTQAADPTSFTMSAASPFSLSASWSDTLNPGANTTYSVKYCTNLAMTTGCNTFTTAAGVKTATLTTGVVPSTDYFAQVTAVSTIGGQSSNPVPVPAFGPVLTPPNVQSITISPNTPQTVVTGNTISYTAVVTDPSGNVIAGQAVNWSATGGGTVGPANGTGTTYTATTPGGPFLVIASLSGYSNATDSVTVIAAGPVVDSFGFAMAPTNKGGTLTVVGHDNVVHSITSNFSASDPGVTFTPASTTSANGVPGTSAVIFPSAGTFTLTDSLGSGVSTFTIVSVPQVLTAISVCATGATDCTKPVTIQTLQNQQFTATCLDQFGHAMPVNLCSVTWSSSGGNIFGSGAAVNFNSPSLGANIRVEATSNGVSGFATVNLVSFDVSAAYAYPVPYKASQGIGVIHFTGLGSASTIRIYTPTGHKVFEIPVTGPTYDWNVKNTSGENLASGVYLFVIESSGGKKNGKLIIIQ